ncbi:MAG: helix-turn-helix transcriptional regulator [Sphingopyxis terrae]|nr:MAG: helix-turn-helix transcriptional regulator [Sphingopyxis terrae]
MTGEALIDDDLVELLRVLAHPVRPKLIFAVRDQELAVGQIESATGIGQPLLSQQLGVLRNARIVETRREAKQIFYRLKPEALAPVRALADQFGASPAATTSTRDASASAAHFARILR